MESFLSFTGRANRKEFWISQSIVFSILVGIFIFVSILSSVDHRSRDTGIFMVLMTCGSIFMAIWITTSTAVRRYHDRNKSSRWIWLCLIPVIGQVWQLIELGFMPGDEDENTYGAPANFQIRRSVALKIEKIKNMPERQPVSCLELDDDYLDHTSFLDE